MRKQKASDGLSEAFFCQQLNCRAVQYRRENLGWSGQLVVLAFGNKFHKAGVAGSDAFPKRYEAVGVDGAVKAIQGYIEHAGDVLAAAALLTDDNVFRAWAVLAIQHRYQAGAGYREDVRVRGAAVCVPQVPGKAMRAGGSRGRGLENAGGLDGG